MSQAFNGKLRGLIYAKYRNASECARALGWSKARLSRIMLGHKEPDISEVADMAKALDVSTDTLACIFLASESTNG